MGRLRHDRQADAELGAAVRRVGQLDVATQLAHDLPRHRETQPGAPLPLGRPKRLEDLGPHVGRHAGAVVGDREQDLPAVGGEACADVDDAVALRHRVDGVGHDVEDDLVDAVVVERRRGHVLVQVGQQHDVFVVRLLLHQADDIVHDAVHLHRFETRFALLAEREHVEHQVVGTVEVPLDDLPALRDCGQFPFVQPALQDIRPAAHALEQVLDVVRQICHRLARGRQAFALHVLLHEPGVLNGQARLVADRGHQPQLVLVVRVPCDRTVQVDDTQHVLARHDGCTDHRAQPQVLHALAAAETCVGYGVG